MRTIGINPFASVTEIADQVRRPILRRPVVSMTLTAPQREALEALLNGRFKGGANDPTLKVLERLWSKHSRLRFQPPAFVI